MWVTSLVMFYYQNKSSEMFFTKFEQYYLPFTFSVLLKTQQFYHMLFTRGIFAVKLLWYIFT